MKREPRESFHLPKDLHEALLAYLSNTDPTPKKSAVLRAALKEFLARREFWPWPPEPKK